MDTTDLDQLNEYFENDYELIKLHKFDAVDKEGRLRGKSPYDKAWRRLQYTSSEIALWLTAGNNVGVRLTDSDLVIDYDPRNAEPGDNPLERFCKDVELDMDSCPMVFTGANGIHLYMKKPAGAPIVETLPAYKGLEFKTIGRQVVAAGSVHPNGSGYVWVIFSTPLVEIQEAPYRMLELLRRPVLKEEATGDGIHTSEQLAEMLSALDPADFQNHGAWLEMMMACHHATGGDGADEFIDWCTSDPQYRDHGAMILQRWNSLRSEGHGRVTYRTLYKVLHEKGKAFAIPKLTTPEEDFADTESADEGDEVNCGAELLKACKEWVLVADGPFFVRRTDLKKYDREQWGLLYSPFWQEKGSVANAAWTNKLPMLRFESLTYLPGASEFPAGEGGVFYNLWRPSGVIAVSGDLTVFNNHLEFMFPDERDRQIVLDYLSWLVKLPPIKIHFALLIRGEQGTGKSAIGRLMRKIIGERNTVEPNNEAIASRFNNWQEAKQLAIIHELMMFGRQEIANHFKPVITEDTLRIELKHTDAYTIPNYINLLCFTNHSDALRLEHGDRRWAVVYSPAKAREPEYYDVLFKYIDSDEGAAAVKHFLMTREVQLDPKDHAPATSAKEEMRALSMSEAEQYLLDLFDAGEHPFDFDLVRFGDVMAKLATAIQQREISCKNPRHTVTKFMRDTIGAVQPPRLTKSDSNGLNYRLWVTRNLEKWENMGPTERAEAYKNRNKK